MTLASFFADRSMLGSGNHAFKYLIWVRIKRSVPAVELGQTSQMTMVLC
jgi:hypothetical protein